MSYKEILNNQDILINELKKINNLNFALSKDIHLPL